MFFLGWLIVGISVAFLLGMAIYAQRYARDAADFLTAGRVAGRYVISIGDLTAGLSVITLVAGAEQNYQTGFQRSGFPMRVNVRIIDNSSRKTVSRWASGTVCPECLLVKDWNPASTEILWVFIFSR